MLHEGKNLEILKKRRDFFLQEAFLRKRTKLEKKGTD